MEGETLVHDRLMDHGKNAWAFTHAQLAIRKRNKTCALPRALLPRGTDCVVVAGHGYCVAKVPWRLDDGILVRDRDARVY